MMWDRFIGKAICLDTNILIFAVEAREPWSSQLRPLFQKFDRGSIRGVASEISIAETLAKPIALADGAQLDSFQELFASDSAIEMYPINRAVLTLAAELRGRSRFKLFDAIHVATAQLARCDYFLTQDERLGRALADQPKWLKLSEII